MTDLLAARAQMAMSLAFHIVFAAIGIAMPLLMVIAEWRYLRTRDELYLLLAKRWAKGTAILFAVGAVSGTVLSFELGLLWPGFMAFAGSIIGMPFALEGFAFFTEAIFLGIYLYGWTRVSTRVHLVSGVIVASSGALSGVFVVIANAWMNTPAGFRLENGRAVDVDPIAAMRNPAAAGEVIHMIVACYAATGFAIAGLHALALLRDRVSGFHRRALGISLAVGALASIVQPATGHLVAGAVAHHQPLKFAATEGQFRTEAGAPLRIGGFPFVERRETRFAVEIPGALSFLAFDDPHAVVRGLEAFPREEWPEVHTLHVAFQVMVAAGMALAALSVFAVFHFVRRRVLPDARWFLRALVLAMPLGFVAIECGWVVTEVGRQPWIVYGVMRTSDAVTPMPCLAGPLVAFTLLYIFLVVVVVALFRRMIAQGMSRLPGPPNPEDASP